MKPPLRPEELYNQPAAQKFRGATMMQLTRKQIDDLVTDTMWKCRYFKDGREKNNPVVMERFFGELLIAFGLVEVLP